MPAEVHLVTAQSQLREHEVLLLPDLEPMGSDSPIAPSPDRGTTKQQKEEALAPSPAAKAAQGVVYRGPQLIVSNPPHPDNFVQTIRQPDLVRRPKLPAPLALPPMVSVAAAKPVLAPQPPPEPPRENTPQEKPPVKLAAVEPIRLPEQQLKVEAPKLPLPAASPADAPLHAVLNSTVPAMPSLAHQETPAKSGNQAHNVLVVNAIPVPEGKPSALPAGELYGAFTVSPVPVTNRPGVTVVGRAGGGAEAKGAPGIGNSSGGGTGTSTAGSGSGSGKKSTGGNGEVAVVHPGTGTGAGRGHGGSIAKGTGNGSGSGGHGSGNGSGPGVGSGSSPFPAIMIQGGSGGSGRSIARAPSTGASEAQASYGITIVASGNSGGGFKDFGIFRDEASYTVYLDMADAGVSGPNWTLQYALNSHRLPDSSDPAPHSHGLLVPPYATAKSLPRFSPEVARRGRGGTIVVFGVISPQGKFEGLQVMQSPDAGLNQLLLDALRKWTFRPAEIDGGKVPVKFLLGVPVNSIPGE
jgi:TonB family protein